MSPSRVNLLRVQAMITGLLLSLAFLTRTWWLVVPALALVGVMVVYAVAAARRADDAERRLQESLLKELAALKKAAKKPGAEA
jgi:hypothetical protein